MTAEGFGDEFRLVVVAAALTVCEAVPVLAA